MTQGLTPVLAAVSRPEAADPSRQCGRCRLLFPAEATAGSVTGLPEWWLCSSCRAVLLPHRPEAHRSA
jgi:hypothetical protein